MIVCISINGSQRLGGEWDGFSGWKIQMNEY